jgi:thiol-disulfide isomerase/thioredoxin
MTNATRSKQRRQGTPSRREQEARRARQRTVWIVVGFVGLIAIVGALLLTGNDDPDAAPSAAPAGEVVIEGATGQPLVAGDTVPTFSAPGLEGGTVSWSDYSSSPTVLVVWASWCPHCQAELPILVPEVQGRAGVELVSITTAVGQQPGPSPQAFLADEGLTLTTAVDDAANTLSTGLGVTGFPTVYYVGSDGTVVSVTSGETSQEAIAGNLDGIAPA